jgi:hypothetical protein
MAPAPRQAIGAFGCLDHRNVGPGSDRGEALAQNPEPWSDASGASVSGVHGVRVSLLDSTEIRFFIPTDHVHAVDR